MSKWGRLSLAAGLAVLTSVLMMTAGCEDDPAMTNVDQYFANHPELEDPRVEGTKPLAITPNIASVAYVGQEIAFRAVGGPSSYRWHVSEPSNGKVTPSKQTDAAVYKALKVAPNTLVVSDSRGHSAIVQIGVQSARALAIVPSSRTITSSGAGSIHGAQLQFQVNGGVPPYGPWRVTNTNLGTIDANSGVYTINEKNGYGINIVTITDSAGAIAQATVTTELATP